MSGRADDASTDYGRLHRRDGGHQEVALVSVKQAQSLLTEANRRQVPVRIRGAGHSMNGSSVPGPGEILLSTAAFRHFRFEEELTVTVGTGAAVWDVDRMLRAHGFELLLCNDGGAAASTVGGFAAAGGIGPDTWRHGGFWETVDELLLLTGAGELIRCRRGDAMFPWMFGSMGQLGLLVEATLRIRRRDDDPAAVYPHGVAGEVVPSPAAWEHNVWFTLFVPPNAWERAENQLAGLARRHQRVWRPRGGYSYVVRFHTFNPPLLYPTQESFVATGVWGMLPPAIEDVDVGGLRALEADFAALVASEPTYRRYVQSELTFRDFDYAAYFGPAVFSAFRGRKLAYDPHLLLGRGSVFT